jgi:hypothetical protein
METYADEESCYCERHLFENVIFYVHVIVFCIVVSGPYLNGNISPWSSKYMKNSLRYTAKKKK